MAYKRNYAQVQFAIKKEGLQKLRLFSNIQPAKKTWPKTKDVSWETLPSLIEQLNSGGLLSPELKGQKTEVQDPCFHDGKVATTRKQVGISLLHTRENFWELW